MPGEAAQNGKVLPRPQLPHLLSTETFPVSRGSLSQAAERRSQQSLEANTSRSRPCMEPQLDAAPVKLSGSSSRTILRIPRRSRASGSRREVVVDTRPLEERVAARKQELLIQKRRELAKVLDKHDDLVREAFHLERFVTLVSFDPKVAKADASPVFEAFRAKYDLVANNLPGSSNLGSSGRRTTRRAINDRRQSLGTTGLTNDLIEASSPSSFRKGKGRQHPPATKGSDLPRKPGLDLSLLSPSTAPPRGRKTGRQSLPSLPPPTAPAEEEIVAQSRRPAISRRPLRQPLASPAKTEPSGDALAEVGESSLQVGSGPVPSQPPPPRKPRKKKAEAPPEPPPPPIKRVRLIHRVPSPTYTHPDQRPPRSFSGQLSAYLQSYVRFEDEGPDLASEQLEQAAYTDATYLQRISELRGEGRLSNPKGVGPSNPEPPRHKGRWDEVVESAIVASKANREAGRLRVNGARRVARIVTAHWEKVAGADDKLRKTEEKRMLTVVKATLKAVLAQWKDAVKFVRLKKADEAKAEQTRRGQQHLDAIIEHSTQAFRAQRARQSRSISLGTSSLGHDSDTPSVDDESEPDRDSCDEASEGEEYDEDQPVPDVEMEVDNDDENSLIVENAAEESTMALGSEVTSVSNGRSRSPTNPRSNGLSRQTSLTDTPDRVPSVNGRRVSFRDPDIDVEDATHSSRSGSPAAHPDKITANGNRMEADLDAGTTYAASTIVRSPESSAENYMSPLKRQRRRHSSPSATGSAPDADAELSDADFDAILDEEAEDLELAAKMEEEGSDSDDSELNALEQDAELPLEELLRQYGYGNALEGDQEEPDAEDEEDDSNPEDQTPEGGENGDIRMSNSSRIASSPSPSSPAVPSRSPSPDVGDSASPKESLKVNGHKSPSPAPNEADDAVDDTSIKDITPPSAMADDDTATIKPPFLLRGTLRPYQQAGLEWLVSLYLNKHNGILADEMGLGKTIQAISLLAYLACEKGIWGPHLIIVPTSVLKNWEMEFKKFLPGFKIIAYYGNAKERKERRHGWKALNAFNVCITSYQLILADQHIFRRMPWVYMILDEAHNIKNFKSQRWQDLFTFRPARRLLLTGTPLQNNLMELWALMHFLNPVETVGYRSDFADWFSKPMDRAIEDGRTMDVETQDRVNKLHTLLRPYLLRRMKADVEKELPGKFEHLVYCRLSKRQRFLYDEFMARAETKEILASGNFLSVVNCLMQLRKVCNHPDLFEVRPIVTSFAMSKSAVADFEIKELLVRRKLLASSSFDTMHHVLGGILSHEDTSFIASRSRRFLDASSRLPHVQELPGEPPPRDVRTVAGFRRYRDFCLREEKRATWRRISYINRIRCAATPIFGSEKLACVRKLYKPLVPLEVAERSQRDYLDRNDLVHAIIKSYTQRAHDMKNPVDHFAFATPVAVALDLPSQVLRGVEDPIRELQYDIGFDTLHTAAVKLQVAFPDAYLLQYDCGKLQELDALLKERRAGGHRVLIFTQMTKVLDVLEIFLNLHGYRYLRLDGSTKIEDRQKITQRFNMDTRVLAFISSSRSGGVGINLTGADTVIFYDSDYNPSMDRQCEDRAHRIGQIRDVHIYRFISKHTVEESMLRKANQKRSLDDIVIRQGEFDWRKVMVSDLQMEQALEQVEDIEDAQAARNAAAEMYMDTAGEQQEFDESAGPVGGISADITVEGGDARMDDEAGEEEEEDELEVLGLTKLEQYMVRFVERDWDFFSEWRVK